MRSGIAASWPILTCSEPHKHLESSRVPQPISNGVGSPKTNSSPFDKPFTDRENRFLSALSHYQRAR